MERLKKYYVKREVIARSMEQALKARGFIYEVSLAGEKDQPEDSVEVKGFKPKV
jgi:hypothetical protein